MFFNCFLSLFSSLMKLLFVWTSWLDAALTFYNWLCYSHFFPSKLSKFWSLISVLQSVFNLRDLGLSDLKPNQFRELVNRLLPGYYTENKVSSPWHTSYVSAESFFENKHGMFWSQVLMRVNKIKLWRWTLFFCSLISTAVDNL